MSAETPTNSIAAFLLARLRGFGAHPILAGNSACARPSWTADELATAVEELAAGLLEVGVGPGDRVLVVADNCDLWLVCDLALLLIGAVDVPRAGDAALEDVLFVAEHSGSVRAILEDGKQLARASEGLAPLGLRDGAVVMKAGAALPEGLTSLEQVRELGRKADPARLEAARRAVSPEDLATIVYTSGTTGNPKGVMLEHRNILHNIRTLPDLVHFNVSDRYFRASSRAGTPSSAPSILAASPTAWRSTTEGGAEEGPRAGAADGGGGACRGSGSRSRAPSRRASRAGRRRCGRSSPACSRSRGGISSRDVGAAGRRSTRGGAVTRPPRPTDAGGPRRRSHPPLPRALASKLIYSKLRAATGARSAS
ncbi:MAG: AMP-binding protein [Planctomycetota bacterium]